MRTVEEQIIEIAERKKRYQAAKISRKCAITGAGLLLMLILVIGIAPSVTEITERQQSDKNISAFFGTQNS